MVDVAAELNTIPEYKRRFQTVFGAPAIRTLLISPGSSSALPIYLPESLGRQLPMCPRFKARLIAEAHPRQDQHETHAAALRAVALARVLPPLGSR